MTPEHFIARWKDNPLTERAGAQAHFDDLCELLGVDKPRDADNYCFERGAKKAGGGDGWADVWKRGHFAWENKKPGRDLDKALKQLTDYALQLDNPPLLVVCDRERIVIHTAFTGYPDEPREIAIEDLREEGKRQLLRWAFTDPLKLRPEKSNAAITEEAAGRFARLAEGMRSRGEDAGTVAHFLVQCLFCMFAEDEGLLPDSLFTELLNRFGNDADKARDGILRLFASMNDGGAFGLADIPWFNGGLFRTIEAPQLTLADLRVLRDAAAEMDWRAIDPTIFGTLFERGLGDRRAPLGAHYTDTGTISKLVDPLVREPLLREWEAVRAQIVAAQAKKRGGDKQAAALYQGFLLRLNQFRVLDPACGSGNFLYLALKALRDVEKRASVEAQELGLQAEVTMQTGPHNILGIEINEFAAELARVTVWIGDIQWCRQNGWPHGINPILKPLDGIDHRDALLDVSPLPLAGEVAPRVRVEAGQGERSPSPQPSPASGRGGEVREAVWPRADVIVGNPPFIGDKKMRGELGDAYVETLRKVYAGRVPGGADFVCYWFEKARAMIEAGTLQAAGLVSTNSIRGGANRKVLERIVETARIFTAWSDEPWVNDGAAVRVSMTGFGKFDVPARLDDASVADIHADLTAGEGVNTTQAAPLKENEGASFIGTQKSGPFDIPGETARAWLSQPNPNGRPNSEVVKPWFNGMDITRRPSDTWIIDFGTDTTQSNASLYELPFQHTFENVKPMRAEVRRDGHRNNWWRHGETRAGMRDAIKPLPRMIGTPRVSKHRVFSWLPANTIPDCQIVVVARGDDATFGILQSRFHELWSLSVGTWMGVGNDLRYTPTTTFETFPFPAGLTPRDTKTGAPDTPHARAIAEAACKLDQLRNNWLNPPEWTDWVITPEEQAAGFPKRPVAKPGFEAELKKRTLTNLYNARPAWLALAHEALDKTVAAAYGWQDYTPAMPDEEILRRLLALNQARA